MRSLVAAWLVTGMLVLLGACQSGTGPSGGAGAPSPSMPFGTAVASPPATSGGPPPEAGATIDPDWITRPALTCGDHERLFPPEALAGLGLGELGLDPAAAVLRATIADTPDYYPDTGWHRVLDTPEGVTFVAPGNAETPWFHITIGRLDNTLQPIIQGECTLAIAPPDGVSFARWWIDPTGPQVGPETTLLSILVREQDCASGKPPEGRVLEPTIITAVDSIQVAVGIREQTTDQDCQGNPAYAVELRLSEPLGARGLFDASRFPPRSVTAEDPG
jgi:hypothetical protein